MDGPRNMNELIDYLARHPLLEVESDVPVLNGPRRYLGYYDGVIWTRDNEGHETFIPLTCRVRGSETGISIDPAGFTIEKFGHSIRYHFREEAKS